MAAAVIAVRTRRVVATPTERAVHAALHTASLAARALRQGLDTDSAQTAAPFLRSLTGTDGVALFDGDGRLLAQDPPQAPIWDAEVDDACEHAASEAVSGQRRVLTHVRSSAVVAQPLLTENSDLLGALVVVTTRSPAPGMLGAVGEVARYAASQIELAELDASRARLDRAEVLALRAQISPHFIYNALNTIASFVRTDPDRARELILEFADFTRYSFRAAGQYTTLAEELRNIDRYLNLERARFGAALTVRLQVAPEVLNVVVPFLALQPLVENAVRHGLAGKGGGSVEIIARDEGSDCVITVEDDGVGHGSRDAAQRTRRCPCRQHRPLRARRADECRSSAARRLRQRLRSGGRNGDRRGHQGRDEGAQVPVGRPGQRRCVRVSKLAVLAVDDEAPALDELAYLLDRHPDIGEVYRAGDATSALRELNGRIIDAIFLDINMPGLSGIELAGVLANFSQRPVIVFVTAHDDKAVAAFDVGAIDYLLKPIRQDRLNEAVRRVMSARSAEPAEPEAAQVDSDVIPAELGGITHLVPRDSIGWVEAEGDYARLHSASGSHLVRIPLSTLETRWRDRGFQRVHRSYLVALRLVTGLRTSEGAVLVRLRANGASPAVELPVSRRQARELRDRVVRDPMRNLRPDD